ncbi:hypothetical protein ABIF73_009162, partial [Bradyrhizobium japonicum]
RVIGPPARDCQRPLSTNRRTVDHRIKSSNSRQLEGPPTAGTNLHRKNLKKSLPAGGLRKGLWTPLWAPSPRVLLGAPRALASGGPSRPDRALVRGRRAPSQAGLRLHPRPDLVPRPRPDGLLAPGRSGNFFHIRRRTRATIPRRSGTDKLESQDASGGCQRFSWGQRKAILQMTQPSSDIRETSRDLYPSSCS